MGWTCEIAYVSLDFIFDAVSKPKLRKCGAIYCKVAGSNWVKISFTHQ